MNINMNEILQFIKLISGDSNIDIADVMLKFSSKNFVDAFKGLDVQQKVKVLEKANPEYLSLIMNDKSHIIRIMVAHRIDPEYLPQMMNDENCSVRQMVSKRIDPTNRK